MHRGQEGDLGAPYVDLGPGTKDEWDWALFLRHLEVRGQGQGTFRPISELAAEIGAPGVQKRPFPGAGEVCEGQGFE